MRTVNLSASMSGGESMIAKKDDGNWAKLKGEVISSTTTDYLKAMPSGWQLVVTQEPLVAELPIPIRDVPRHAWPQGLKVLRDVLASENYRVTSLS